MTKSFTIYWTPDGWAGIGEGNPITGAWGTGFKEKIPPGSRIFVTNIQSGVLRLVGAFTAGSIEEVNPTAETWNASEQLIAESGTSSPVKLTVVPTQITKSLQFIKSDGTESAVAFDEDGYFELNTYIKI